MFHLSSKRLLRFWNIDWESVFNTYLTSRRVLSPSGWSHESRCEWGQLGKDLKTVLLVAVRWFVSHLSSMMVIVVWHQWLPSFTSKSSRLLCQECIYLYPKTSVPFRCWCTAEFCPEELALLCGTMWLVLLGFVHGINQFLSKTIALSEVHWEVIFGKKKA